MEATIKTTPRMLRLSKRISQDRLAVLARVSRPTVSRIEAGRNVSMRSVARVASALGLAPGELLALMAQEDRS